MQKQVIRDLLLDENHHQKQRILIGSDIYSRSSLQTISCYPFRIFDFRA